jgi:hypothetical protein
MKIQRCEFGAKWQKIQVAEIKMKIPAFLLVIVSGKTWSC